MIDSGKIAALANWLIAGAPPKQSFSDLVGEIGRRLVAAGLQADHFALYSVMIHPEMPGQFYYWTKAGGSRHMVFSTAFVKNSDAWIGTPPQVCMTSGRLVVHTLGSAPDFDGWTIAIKYGESGYRQFVYTPLHSRYSLAASVASYGSKAPQGFSAEELHILRQIQAPMARITEAFVLHEGTVQVLSTYVGRGAGQRVLQGNILRGDAEIIPSIVLFTDLKNFTALSNSRPASEVMETLNSFYDVAETAIVGNGGEVLKFMGDGLLAIFPTPDDLSAQLAAASGAITALEETRAALIKAGRTDIQFRAALHLGDIHYGNIGSKSRLDFTAIGPTVNLAARLMPAADEFGAETVCSEVFHRLIPGQTALLGERQFKGFESPQQIYRVSA